MKTRLCAPVYMPNNQRTALTAALRRADLIENIEWLLKFNRGEHEILQAAGYAHRPTALKKQLSRHHRNDLIPRIFTWDATANDRKMSA